jgi:oxygen-independent coproporphyrinogen-3 oxidase
MNETSLYIHVPFCNRRCGYCDFNTFAGMNQFIPEYVDSLCQELKVVGEQAPQPIRAHTIYFGGGTPSLLNPSQVDRILNEVSKHFVILSDAEITLEANPGTVTLEQLTNLKSLGVNRLSFGMQSVHPSDLRILDREHTYEDITRSILWSKKAGFEHLNLDLIFGIPGQTLERWKQTLYLAFRFGVDHYSLYSLSIEEGTPLKRWTDRGLLREPDDDLAARMYEYAIEKLDHKGFSQYEISNWALRPGGGSDSRCRHNLQYWRYLPYLGFGAGAHGFYNGVRTENESKVDQYIELVKKVDQNIYPAGPACISSRKLSKWDQMQEYLMVGFRLTEEGISKNDFMRRYSISPEIAFKSQFELLMKQGLIKIHPQTDDRIRLTKKGRMFGNRVFMQFVGNDSQDGFE